MDCFSSGTLQIDWVAMFALIISIATLIIGVRFNRKTLQMTEVQNKKSVEPLITDIFVADAMIAKNKNSTASYDIKNCGLGPAIIKSFYFKLDNNTYDHILEIYSKFLGSPKYITDDSSVFTLEVYHIIASNDSLNLFTLSFKEIESYLPFVDLMMKVSFEVEYETIYGDKKSFTKEHLITIK